MKPLYLFTTKITHGECEFESHSIHASGDDQTIKDHLESFYDGTPEWDGDICYFHGGEIAVELKNCQAITDEQAKLLKELQVAA